MVPPNDVPGIVAALRQMLELWDRGEWGLSAESSRAIENYHIDRQASAIVTIMNRLAAQ